MSSTFGRDRRRPTDPRRPQPRGAELRLIAGPPQPPLGGLPPTLPSGGSGQSAGAQPLVAEGNDGEAGSLVEELLSDPAQEPVPAAVTEWVDRVLARHTRGELLFSAGPNYAALPEILTPELAEALELARAAEARRHAKGTRDNYLQHWREFDAWCSRQEIDADHASPEIVAAYLMVLSNRSAQHVAIRARGTEQEERVVTDLNRCLSAANITSVMCAINNRLKVTLGETPLQRSAFLQHVMTVVRRDALAEQMRNAKDPLLAVDIKALIDVTYRPWAQDLLDTASVLLLAHGVELPAQVRLRWKEHVSFTATGVTLQLHSGTRSSRTRELPLPFGPEDRCPVRALQRLHQPATEDGRANEGQPVFARARAGHSAGATHRGRLGTLPFTLGGLTARLNARCEAANVTPAAVRGGGLRVLGKVLAQIQAPHTIDVRDRALILIGYTCLLRRSNVSWLEWGDVHWRPGVLRLHLKFQKNDQQGRGHDVTANPASTERYCPVTALKQWRTVLSALDTAPGRSSTEPVFASLSRHGQPRDREGAPMPLSPDGVHQVVMKLIGEAELEGNFSSHSMRIGGATQMLMNGRSIRQVQAHGDWQNPEMVIHYDRRHNGDSEAVAAALAL